MAGSIITVKTRNGATLYLDSANRFSKDRKAAKVFDNRRIAEHHRGLPILNEPVRRIQIQGRAV